MHSTDRHLYSEPINPEGRADLVKITSLLCLLLVTITAWLAFAPVSALAYSDYSGCESCHGTFNTGNYTSLQDSVEWGVALMDAHQSWVQGECLACHMSAGPGAVRLNESGDDTFTKSCVGCHGRDEDVNGECVDGIGSGPECGSGAGLRRVHENKGGVGTCTSCHTSDATPAGEDVLPYNYSLAASSVKNSCNADGSESRFGNSGLDNDGDGNRDAADSDCGGFQINPGLSDAWYYPLTAGQGFLITVLEDTGIVFLAWFTFDVERPPADATAILGEPGHRWLTAQGPYEGDTATLDVFISSGGVFDSADPAVPPPTQSGTMTIRWADCSSATLNYDLPEAGQGEIPLERIVPDNVPLCEALQ